MHQYERQSRTRLVYNKNFDESVEGSTYSMVQAVVLSHSYNVIALNIHNKMVI